MCSPNSYGLISKTTKRLYSQTTYRLFLKTTNRLYSRFVRVESSKIQQSIALGKEFHIISEYELDQIIKKARE